MSEWEAGKSCYKSLCAKGICQHEKKNNLVFVLQSRLYI